MLTIHDYALTAHPPQLLIGDALLQLILLTAVHHDYLVFFVVQFVLRKEIL